MLASMAFWRMRVPSSYLIALLLSCAAIGAALNPLTANAAGCKELGGTETGCYLAPTKWVNNSDPAKPRWDTFEDAAYGMLPFLQSKCPRCTYGLLWSPAIFGPNTVTSLAPAPDSYIKMYAYAWGQYAGPGSGYVQSGILNGTIGVERHCPGMKSTIYTVYGQKRYYCVPYKSAFIHTRDVLDSDSGLDATTEGCTTSCNPVNLSTGAKRDYVVDYENLSPYPIVWARSYSSRRAAWTFNYTQRIEAHHLPASGLGRAKMVRPDGAMLSIKTASISTTSAPSTWVMDMDDNQS